MGIDHGQALCPALQPLYEQAVAELSQYGREEDHYFCRRLNRYVSEEEVSKVSALEIVLTVLEEENKENALEIMALEGAHWWIDDATRERYVELIKACFSHIQ
jgi:hypothetical protein